MKVNYWKIGFLILLGVVVWFIMMAARFLNDFWDSF